jgi:hypothetical protein
MALPAIGTTNFGIGSVGADIKVATGCNQSTNLSLKGLMIGTGGLTFDSAGGPCVDMTGGSPPPTIGDAPYAMSEVRGLFHDDDPGGGGGGGPPQP